MNRSTRLRKKHTTNRLIIICSKCSKPYLKILIIGKKTIARRPTHDTPLLSFILITNLLLFIIVVIL